MKSESFDLERSISLPLQSPRGDPLGARSEITLQSPRKLLSSSRVDVAVKYMFAQSVLGKSISASPDEVASIYRQHIMIRTKGREPYREASKSTLFDFEEFYRELIRDTAENGFDFTSPIQVSGTTGQILNGAHRLAAALSLGLDTVSVRMDFTAGGRSWDLNWFRDYGFSVTALNLIKSTWLELTEATAKFVLVWPPALERFRLLNDSLTNFGETMDVAWYELGEGFAEFVLDVYSFQHGPNVSETAPHIREKARRLQEYGTDVALILLDQSRKEQNMVTQDLKLALRTSIRIDSLPEQDTVHMADTQAEQEHLEMIMLNERNMRSYREIPALGANLTRRLETLKEVMESLQLPRLSCSIVGGSVLELHGIKEADDLDIVLSPESRRGQFGPKSHKLCQDVDLVAENYFRQVPVEERGQMSDRALVSRPANYIYRRGYKFENIELLIQKKRYSQRPKDLADLRLIAANQATSGKDRDGTAIGLRAPELTGFAANERIQALDESSAEKLLSLANEAHIAGDLLTASGMYNRVLALDKENHEALCGLGLCALHRGDLVVASGFLSEALRVVPNYSPALLAMQQVQKELQQQTKSVALSKLKEGV